MQCCVAVTPKVPKMNSTLWGKMHVFSLVQVLSWKKTGCVSGEYIVKQCVCMHSYTWASCLCACWSVLQLSLFLTGWRDYRPARALIGFRMPTWSYPERDSEHLCYVCICVCVCLCDQYWHQRKAHCVLSIIGVHHRRLMAAVRQIGSSHLLQGEAISRLCINLCNLDLAIWLFGVTMWSFIDL